MKLCIVIFILLNGIINASCPDESLVKNNLKMLKIWLTASKTCVLQITTLEVGQDMQYRSYMFSSMGMFMIFNSYGPGDESKDTSARVFYFWPSGFEPMVTEINDHQITVSLAPEHTISFSTDTVRIQAMSAVSYTEDPVIKKTNRGGVELLSYQGVWLDDGYKLGEDPKTNPKGLAIFRRSDHSPCQVTNREIFEYRPEDLEWEIPFRFQSESEWQLFLTQRCGWGF